MFTVKSNWNWILSSAHELEVEGDGSVFVAEKGDLFKKAAQKQEDAGPYKDLPPIRSVSSSTCIQYQVRLPFHQRPKSKCFLNVAHKQGCRYL